MIYTLKYENVYAPYFHKKKTAYIQLLDPF